jgi:isoleucyl-tRNA synthetase
VYQEVSQFIAVELSAIYHDVVKDRLYTDAANSRRRRSTQTALHHILVSLCKMLSPLLAFTAEEAWDFVPAKTVDSAHRLTWQPMNFERDQTERSVWKKLFELRELALPVLEKARQAKEIGKALEAKLIFAGADATLKQAETHLEELRELLNVSQLEIKSDNRATVDVSVRKAAGQKCERCWHWETDVGCHSDHPTICGRCVKAISQAAGG